MPLAVHLNVSVIEAINHAIAVMRRADPGREIEIGGILLGSVETKPGTRPIVRVTRFDPVDSEHRRGSSFLLSDRDRRVVARKLDWWNRHQDKEGLQPVGFFRSHTRRGLYLDNDDFTFFQQYFPEQTSVFLLVRPIAGADSVAGFYFWEQGDIHREASYQEFPFHAARLPLTSAEPAPEPAAVVAPLVAEPVVAEPVVAEAATSQPVKPQPRTMALPPPVPAAVVHKSPVWMQIAVPLVIGVALGAVVFKLTTRGAAVPMRPAAAAPTQMAKSSPAPAPAPPTPVEKPSPFDPKSRQAAAAPAPMLSKPVVPKPVTSADRTASVVQPPSPTGSDTRVANPAASHPVTAVVEPSPTPVVAAAPPPTPLAPIAEPARVERPRRPPSVATVTVEPVSGSKLGRIVGHLPGFHRRQKDFVPARAIRQVAPSVPATEHLTRDVPVDVRITVDPAGNVAGVEPASRGADRQLVQLASDAARGWHFVPARRNDETVSSELILHFKFPGSTPAEP